MTLTIEPTGAGLGARVRGVDLRDLSDADFTRLHRAWLDHQVLVFEDQDLSVEDQMGFASRLGPLERVRTAADHAVAGGAAMYVANRRVDGKEGVLPEGEMLFHTDQCYYEEPCQATLLYAIEVPAVGGDTLFADAYGAFATLDRELRDRLWGLRALNVYDYAGNPTGAGGAGAGGEPDPDAPRAVHPVVIRHPVTGRPALYVNRLMTVRLLDTDPDESAALLGRLFDHQEQDRFVYHHRWRPGDLVLWDNRCVLHARTAFDPAARRILRRVTVRGERPVAAAPAPS